MDQAALEIHIIKLKTFDSILRVLLEIACPTDADIIDWRVNQLEETIWEIPPEERQLWDEWTKVLTAHLVAVASFKQKLRPSKISVACQTDEEISPSFSLNNSKSQMPHNQGDSAIVPDVSEVSKIELQQQQECKNSNQEDPIVVTLPTNSQQQLQQTHSEETLINLESTPPPVHSLPHQSPAKEGEIEYPLIDNQFEASVSASNAQFLKPQIREPQIKATFSSSVQQPQASLVSGQSQPTPSVDCLLIDAPVPSGEIDLSWQTVQPPKKEKKSVDIETLRQSLAKAKLASLSSQPQQPPIQPTPSVFANEKSPSHVSQLSQGVGPSIKPKPRPTPQTPPPFRSDFERTRAKLSIRTRLTIALYPLPSSINSGNISALRALLSAISLTASEISLFSDDAEFQKSLFDVAFSQLSPSKCQQYYLEMAPSGAEKDRDECSNLHSLLYFVKMILFYEYVDANEVNLALTCNECTETGHSVDNCPHLLSSLCELCHGVGGEHLTQNCPNYWNI